ncbi:MAG: TraR/DksA C4-type zinc finger protein [Candidatus Omnitrophica bacterium]|nr:TraR/DksA C4-type zinc finger protein [Candidatus Omnitrophota bacterium]
MKPKNKKSKIKPRKNTKARLKKTGKSLFSKSDLKKFKAILIRQRADVVNEMENITKNTLKTSQREASGDLSGYTLHMADMASDHYDREFSLGIASAEQRVIYEIDEALKRIEDASYGGCFTCGKHIARKRLKAVPYAKYCIECQEKEELTQKRGV